MPIIDGHGGTDNIFYHSRQLFFKGFHANELCAYHELHRETVCSPIVNGVLFFAVPVAGHLDCFLVAYDNKIELVEWNTLTNLPGRKLAAMTEVDLQKNEFINSGTGDPFGGVCFWTLRMSEPVFGKVWTFGAVSFPSLLEQHRLVGLRVSNGILWDLTHIERIYCVDGLSNRIMSFTYNLAEKKFTGFTGIAFDLNAWIESLEHPLYTGHAMLGRMTIDTNGRIWVPLNGGSHVLQIDPVSRGVLQAIAFRAVRVTACVFGGEKLNILYVSSIPYGGDAAPVGDQGGKIFAVTGLGEGVKGREAWPYHMPETFMRQRNSMYMHTPKHNSKGIPYV
ncbi:regucalcin-like [Belonocnema kinseyi]|uniref:regucalcin-like n=1 Tax=Belonocnema kinseyi TaxID=2817044 RepID=UPI00143DE864|nr:regucalcin-like [Belonocnema kinseyi]